MHLKVVLDAKCINVPYNGSIHGSLEHCDNYVLDRSNVSEKYNII